METLIHPAFAAVLADQRERLNARFSLARRNAPQLDGQVFLTLIRTQIDQIVRSLVDSHNSSVQTWMPTIVPTLYDTLLTLTSKGFIGPKARFATLERHWTGLMQTVLPAVLPSAVELIGPLTNALVHLEQTPGVRVGLWCELMAKLATRCTDAMTFKAAGQVAAWRCGMAMYRNGALAIARSLDSEVAACILLPESMNIQAVPTVLARLAVDPWYDSTRVRSLESGLQIVGEVGGFRGLGGMFRQPPLVATQAGLVHVNDCESTWVLMSDAFGTVFTRSGVELPDNLPSAKFRLSKDGTVKGPTSQRKWPIFAGASSYTATETTLAITLPHSHRIFLLTESLP